ncbi:MAG: WG repeat-containing protein [Chitinophagales bacterium]
MKRNVITLMALFLSVILLKAQDEIIKKTYYQNGIFRLSQNNLDGFATLEDSIILPIQYKSLSFVNDTIVKVANSSGKFGLITMEMDTLFPLELDKLESFYNGLAVAYKDGKFGMINAMGTVVIPFEYSYLSKFSDDLIAFRKATTCGVMDVNQKVVLPEGKFKFIYEFVNGYAIASSNENSKFGIINVQGDWLVAPQYDNIYRQLEDRFKTVLKVQQAFKRWENIKYETKYGYIDADLNTIFEPEYPNLTMLGNGNFYVSNDSQALVINTLKDTLYQHSGPSYYLGAYHIKIYSDSLSRYAILNQNGQLESDFVFSTLSYYNDAVIYGTQGSTLHILNEKSQVKASIENGRAITYNDDYAVFSDNIKLYLYEFKSESIIKEVLYPNVKSVHFNNNDLFINQKNHYSIYNVPTKNEIQLPFDGISQPVDGLSIVDRGFNAKGVIDIKGNFILEPKFLNIVSIADGIILAKRSSTDTTFAYDYNGKKIFPLPQGADFKQFSDGMLLVKENYIFYYLNKQGDRVFTANFPCGDFYNDRAAFQNYSGLIGFYDKTGNEVIPAKYSEFGNFNSIGLAGVKDPQTNLWGYINQSGDLVVPHQYEKIGDFKNGYAIVSKNGKLGQINKAGTVIVPIEYDETVEFSDGYFGVKKDGLWGFINEKGKLKIPLQFENTAVFKDGLCWVKKDGQLQLIDSKGQIKLNTSYTNANNYENGVAIVVNEQSKYGVIDKNGNLILPLEYDYLNQIDDNTIIIGYAENWSKLDMKLNH